MKIAVISDVHEDVLSLQKALKKIEKKKPDTLACLGDISGFSVPHYSHIETRNASLCLEIIKGNCDIIIPGNHDYFASKRLPKISSEFVFPDVWYNLDYQQKRELSGNILWLNEENELDPLYSKADIEFLKEINEDFLLEDKLDRILFTHYVYPNLSGMSKNFYFHLEEMKLHFKYLKERDVKLSVVGHSHPKGLLFYTREKIFDSGFKKKEYPDENVCFVTPSITLGGRANGFLTIDTDNREVEAVRI